MVLNVKRLTFQEIFQEIHLLLVKIYILVQFKLLFNITTEFLWPLLKILGCSKKVNNIASVQRGKSVRSEFQW